MASFNLTVEDSSPLISYSPAGGWADTPFTDNIISTYSGGSFHITTTPGSSVTFEFNGTGMSVIGGRRTNYGTYTLSVDGRTVTTGSAQSAQDEAQQVLAAVDGLSNGPHTAVLTSTGGTMDIDFIQLTTQVDPNGSSFIVDTVDDGNPNVVYSPPTAWQVNSNQDFMGGSLHFTQDPTASATLAFSGDAIAIYGTTAPDHTDCVVEIDGQPTTIAGGSGGRASGLHAPVLMFFRNGLGPGSHTMKLAAQSPTSTAPFFDLDSISVYSPSENTAVGPTPGVPLPSSSPAPSAAAGPVRISSGISTGTLVGSIMGGVIGLLALAAIAVLLFIRRRRRRRTDTAGGDTKPTSEEAPTSPGGLPMQYPTPIDSVVWGPTREASLDVSVTIPPRVVPAAQRHSIAPSYYSEPTPAAPAPLPLPLSATMHSRNGSKSSTASSQAPLLSIQTSGLKESLLGKDRGDVNNPGPGGVSQVSGVKPTPARPKLRPPTMDMRMVGSPV